MSASFDNSDKRPSEKKNNVCPQLPPLDQGRRRRRRLEQKCSQLKRTRLDGNRLQLIRHLFYCLPPMELPRVCRTRANASTCFGTLFVGEDELPAILLRSVIYCSRPVAPAMAWWLEMEQQADIQATCSLVSSLGIWLWILLCVSVCLRMASSIVWPSFKKPRSPLLTSSPIGDQESYLMVLVGPTPLLDRISFQVAIAYQPCHIVESFQPN